ncbi:hypothetical protein [Clostridium haemolyticum]|uniref:Uncharacterized protein n=1 Tax=Clostridium haemolyticum NCTC 9693 TaxID=1443114 RepID=A0ABR4TAL5_CLOHA|nr:hypothetical protein [Clostridium haemolyticum]KEI14012.1 hypothetical protein Z960_p0005 [Clostridium haemolyticum NCTC 9693]
MSLEKILETIKDSYIGGHFTILSLDNQLQCDAERYGHENIYFDSIYDGEMREEVESESHCFIIERKTNITDQLLVEYEIIEKCEDDLGQTEVKVTDMSII